MTIEQLHRDLRTRIGFTLDSGEARWIARIVMESVFGLTHTDLLIKGEEEASAFRCSQVDAIAARIVAGEPVQQVLGFEMFMGMKLKVTPDVLIPRPETAELVDLILDREGAVADLKVFDGGTGSGCIALALARRLRFPHVTAVDVSQQALAVARENAASLRVRNVTFLQADMLALPLPAEPYHIIVSNPPYVMEREKASMSSNVLHHEPALALFVPDIDPLRFYSALSSYALEALETGGRIYFELNPITAATLCSLMRSQGWLDVETYADSSRLTRFLSARKA